MFLYLCLACGAWRMSSGIEEIFGTLKTLPGQAAKLCCETPMYHVCATDRLRVEKAVATGPLVKEAMQTDDCGQNVDNFADEQAVRGM